MLQFAVIRPGSNDFDQQGRLQGKLSIPLNAQGLEEVTQLTHELRGQGVDVIYSATSEPAWETAQTLASALDVKLKKIEHLSNVDLGLWEGMLIEEVKRKHPKIYRRWEELAENVCPPEGETLGEARLRVIQALIQIVRKHSSGLVAIVAPWPISDLIATCLKEGDLGEEWEIQGDHGKWAQLLPRRDSLVGSGISKNP